MDFSQTPVALIIFVLMIVTSVYTLFFNNSAIYNLIFSPYDTVRYNRWHTLITSGFIHANLPHLAFNALSFYFFCFDLERKFGSTFFFVLYMVSMLIADLPSLFKHKDNPNYKSLGASGAISGCIFSFILFYPNVKMYLMLIPIGIPAYIFGPLYLAYSYYVGKMEADNINHDAHLWGALAGAVLTIIYEPRVIGNFLSNFGF
jgi:membrane associated rhomboid family serine protease